MARRVRSSFRTRSRARRASAPRRSSYRRASRGGGRVRSRSASRGATHTVRVVVEHAPQALGRVPNPLNQIPAPAPREAKF